MALESRCSSSKMCKPLLQAAEDSFISVDEFDTREALPNNRTFRLGHHRLKLQHAGRQTPIPKSSLPQPLAVPFNVIGADIHVHPPRQGVQSRRHRAV